MWLLPTVCNRLFSFSPIFFSGKCSEAVRRKWAPNNATRHHVTPHYSAHGAQSAMCEETPWFPAAGAQKACVGRGGATWRSPAGIPLR